MICDKMPPCTLIELTVTVSQVNQTRGLVTMSAEMSTSNKITLYTFNLDIVNAAEMCHGSPEGSSVIYSSLQLSG